MNPPSVLIVDDEPDNFDVIEALLSNYGYNLHYASNGYDAIASLDVFKPDLILLDVMMPGIDGIQVCQQIKQQPQWRAIPIIVVTALSEKTDLARCLDAGADDFASKPINATELRARVHSMLRIKQQYDALQSALERQQALEQERIKLLAQHNIELEQKVAARTAELEESTALIKHNALHDPLTGLPNRTLLLQEIEQAIARAQSTQVHDDSSQYAVLFVALDRLNVINDSLGHRVGDQLLQMIAQRLVSYLNTDDDVVARFGGQEFVLLLNKASHLDSIISTTDSILKGFQAPLLLGEYQLFVSLNIGIVLGNSNYDEPSELIRDADIAMHHAKAKGTYTYQIFNADMHAQALYRLNLESDLRQAIDRNEFVVYYQPIVDILGDRLIGFEALIRWQHPKHGFISPADFIPIAEETGLILSIDHWVLNIACRQLAAWKAQFSHFLPIKVSINLSAQDLRKSNLIEEIDYILDTSGLPGEALTLEITESILVEDITKTISLLTQLKEKNIQISIDDFGTGYSSLNYLHRLPADYLKIDQSFVGQMQAHNRNYQVVNTIITLSNQLGLTVVAEGIETPQQLQWLRQMECEFGQGYLFSKPLPTHELEKILMQKNYSQLFQKAQPTHHNQ